MRVFLLDLLMSDGAVIHSYMNEGTLIDLYTTDGIANCLYVDRFVKYGPVLKVMWRIRNKSNFGLHII